MFKVCLSQYLYRPAQKQQRLRARLWSFASAFAFLAAPLPSTGLMAQATQVNVGAVQLKINVEADEATVNGESVQFTNLPQNVNGRMMLPLRETARLLDRPLTRQAHLFKLGDLDIDTNSNVLSLKGVPQAYGNIANVNDVLYISARLLAQGLKANFTAYDNGNIMTITVIRDGGNPLLPQARFSTDKNVYAPGERVLFSEYSFDPDGAAITARKWSGRKEVYFDPGTYTISLQVINTRGKKSKPTSRTIKIEGTPVNTRVSYALKHTKPGDAFQDFRALTYPDMPAQIIRKESFPLLFSDSPESPTRSGILYQDSIFGRARLLAYHMNKMNRPARLYVVARNLEDHPVDVQTERFGETAPTRIEGQLGQITLLEYFASKNTRKPVKIDAGQSAVLYASPTLVHGTGVNMMQDVIASGRVEITFAMLEASWQISGQVLRQVPYLPLDGRHQRGTFPNAIRAMLIRPQALPARLTIGDGKVDPAIQGIDKLTGKPMQLLGNYGVLYDLEVIGARNTAIALVPRGGLYRGAMHIQDGKVAQTVRMPRKGNAIKSDKPVLLWRPATDRIKIDFIPASGSNLPVSFIFYRTNDNTDYSETGGTKRQYIP